MAYRKDWERIIRAYAPKYGVDPNAAVSVAMAEGLSGAVGDNGTSFGPFQLHVGGALPSGRGRAWAESQAGILYALSQMAKAGARGKRGHAAIQAIVHNFERPADPHGEVARALQNLRGMGGKGALPMSAVQGASPMVAPSPQSLGLPGPGGQDALRMQLLQALRSRTQAFLSNSQIPSLSMIPALSEVLAPSPEPAMPRLTGPGLPVNGRIPGQVSLGGGRPVVRGNYVMPLSTSMGRNSEYSTVDAEGAPSANGRRYHAAKDWFAPAGSAVRSPWAGKVVEVKASRGNSGQVFGGTVKVQAPNGRVFVVRHVDPRHVKVGQKVKAGQVLAGVTDWTGGSDHAHVEIWKTLAGGYRYENMLDPIAVFGGTRRGKRK